jgi:SAM-dependent methyltransferase
MFEASAETSNWMERTMSFISVASERLTYFDSLLGKPDWERAKVLDFGGNRGASLSSGRIRDNNYWCLDVSRDAMECGKREHPNAHWIFYDRYNFHFNPTGVPGLPIPFNEDKFDYILAYSVFTHTSKEEMIELVTSLRTFLRAHGKLAFTFIDPHFILPPDYGDLLRGKEIRTNLRLRLEKIRLQNPAVPLENMLHQATGADWCTVVNYSDIYVNHEQIGHYSTKAQKLYDTFYTPACMERIFSGATIMPPPEDYNAGGAEMQHCCVLGAFGNPPPFE